MTEIKTYYVADGNVVRQVEEALPSRQERERRTREDQERNRRRAQLRKKAALRKKKIYSVYMAMAVVAAVGLFVGYVDLSNSITTHRSNISSLEQEISDLKASNSATESRIASETNLAEIKTTAMNELGMVYANSNQIVYYDMDSNDYMNQYQNIP